MHWQEAAKKSDNFIAKRYDHNVIYYRYLDGSAIKYLCTNRFPVIADKKEVEGYLDWEPDRRGT